MSQPDFPNTRSIALLQEPSNTLILSVTSVWEMQIKLQLGKLTLCLPLAEIIASQQQTNSMILLPITLFHTLALEGLPLHHKDPFDRMLIARAIAEDAVLVSCDPIFAKYPVQLVW